MANLVTRASQSLHRRKQWAVEFIGHRSFYANPTLPGQMTVEQDVDMDPAVLGVYQGVDHAVAVLAEEVANQEQRQLD